MGAGDQWNASSHSHQERLQPMSRASLPRPLLLCDALQPSAWWGETKTNDSLLLNCSWDRRGWVAGDDGGLQNLTCFLKPGAKPI